MPRRFPVFKPIEVEPYIDETFSPFEVTGQYVPPEPIKHTKAAPATVESTPAAGTKEK